MSSSNLNRWTTDPEYIELLNFLIERTENVKSPMNVAHLARGFKEKSGTALTESCLKSRIERMRKHIHSFEHIETETKVRMLFALSAPVDRDFLQEVSNDALVEVDGNNRITNYKSERLELNGFHRLSSTYALICSIISLKQRKILRERAFVKVDEMNRITHYKATNDRMELRGDHSLAAKLKTAHFDSVLSHRAHIFETPKSSKRKADIWISSSSKRTDSSPDHSSLELHFDYDTNYSIDDQVKLEPFRGSIQEDLNEFKEDEDIKQIPKPQQAHNEHNQIEEVPIKIEVEEPIEVKPVTSHNSKIKFFEALQSLILCLDNPCLSGIESIIYQKIQEIEGSCEVILNNEIVVNLSENVESVNFSNFLCYLKASILNSKMSGMKGLVQNISKLIEESQNKRVPMEKVSNALRATLDIDDSQFFILSSATPH